jgi:hypothetical protein
VLKGVAKQFVAMVPQEYKQLGPTDALADGVFRWRQRDRGMPQGWTPGRPSLLSSKKTMVHHAITPQGNTRPMF